MSYSRKAQRLLLAASLLWAAFVFSQSLLPGPVSSSEWVHRVASAASARSLRLGSGVGGAPGTQNRPFYRICPFGRSLSANGPQPRLLRGRLTLPLFWGLLTPVADESLQLLVEGRSGQLTDVLLDFSGVLAGMGVCLLILWIQEKSGRLGS